MPEVEKFEDTRTDVDEFLGGLPVDLDKEMSSGQTVRAAMKHEIATTLETELNNQAGLIKKIEDWQKQYRGELEEKVIPYVGAANMNVPLTRWLVDTVLVRIVDVIFGQQRVWIVRALKPEFKELARQLEEGLDWWRKFIKYKKKIFSPLMQSIKMGTGIKLFEYRRKKRVVPLYATQEDKDNKDIKKYKTAEGELLIKKTITTYEGPDIYGVSREDFVASSDAATIEDAFLVGYRTYLRRAQVEAKVRSRLYYDEILSALQGDDVDETKKARAGAQEKKIEDWDREKLQIWKLYIHFDVDEDGEEDDILVTYHKETGIILRAIYNPLFYGFRPLNRFVPLPVEYSLDGDAACGILEKMQEEINSQHNQRLDRMNQINAPMWKIREGSGVEDDKIYPGKKWVVPNITTDIDMMQFADVYPSTFTEEAIINSYAEKSVGVTPGIMGVPTAERPVARETMALIQEANKKFKFMIDNIRDQISEDGWTAVEMFAQYQPRWEYKTEEGGEIITKTIDFPQEYLRDNIAIDLAASSELLNQEVRREVNIVAYNLVKDYVRETGQLVQALGSGMIPPACAPFFIAVIYMGNRMMREILKDFNIIDTDEILDSLEKSIDVNAIMQQSQMMIQQMQAQQMMAAQGQQQPQKK